MNDTLEQEQTTVECLPLVLPTVEPTNVKEKITVKDEHLQNEVNRLTYEIKMSGEEVSDKDIIELATRNIQTQKKLVELADKVNSIRQDIQNNEVLSRSHGKITLDLALKAGELLNQCQEEIDYEDQWKLWVSENIKDITYKTVRNYIRLYEYQVKHVSPYEECDSLREAYILCGVVKVKIQKDKSKQPTVSVEEGEPKGEEGPEDEQPEYNDTIIERCKRLEQELRTVFLENSTMDNYGEMVSVLVPLVTIFNSYQTVLQLPNRTEVSETVEPESPWFDTTRN